MIAHISAAKHAEVSSRVIHDGFAREKRDVLARAIQDVIIVNPRDRLTLAIKERFHRRQ